MYRSYKGGTSTQMLKFCTYMSRRRCEPRFVGRFSSVRELGVLGLWCNQHWNLRKLKRASGPIAYRSSPLCCILFLTRYCLCCRGNTFRAFCRSLFCRRLPQRDNLKPQHSFGEIVTSATTHPFTSQLDVEIEDILIYFNDSF